jgi:competence protein ComEC
MRRIGAALVAAVCAAAALSARAASQTLDIYFIDVEGGQSTLIVTPAGESLLVDTGYAGPEGRDAGRVADAARAAGLTKIDYLVVTHFHGDHAGGIPAVAKRLPIGTFVDHDTVVPGDPSATPVFNAYAPVRAGGRHLIAKPGDKVPLEGVDVQIVASDRKTITQPLPGGGQPNAACPSEAPEAAEPTENPRSTGFHLRFGRFRFIDLGDLSGAPLFALFCPKSLLGPAEVYLVPHHGGSDTVYPATLAAKLRVAIMNNGEKKGGAAEAFSVLHGVSGLDVWQLHRSGADGARNYEDARVANLDERTAHWIKVSAKEDGTFTVTNGRTGESREYR